MSKELGQEQRCGKEGDGFDISTRLPAMETSTPAAGEQAFVLSSKDLKKIDYAIQMKIKLNRSPQNRLTFEAFYKILRNVEWNRSIHTSSSAPVTSASLYADEKCLLEFLQVFSPRLYKFYKGPNLLQAYNMFWFIESCFLGTSQDRRDELDMCLQSRLECNSIDNESAIRAIEDHRNTMQGNRISRIRIVKSDASTLEKDSKGPSVIQADMTIDERVRARANAKRTRKEKSLEDESSANRSRDRDLMMRVANQLWQHSSHVLAKRRKMLSPAQSTSSQSMMLALPDVLEILMQSLLKPDNQNSNNSDGGPSSKRQLVEVLQKLCHVAPEYLVMSEENGSGSQIVSKNATVCIKPANYKLARARLSGAGFSDVDGTSREPHTGRDGQRAQEKRRSTTEDSSATDQSASNGRDLVRVVSLSGTKRLSMAPEGSSVETEGIRSKQVKRELRVNPNLILSPADHAGGELIDVRHILHGSPRALKKLLERMKAGQRI